LNLAGESNIWRQVRDLREARDLGVSFRARLAVEYLNPARRATSVASAPVQNINA
jgi:hypothetical protein